MHKWAVVNPLVSDINEENLSIVSNNALHAAKVLYERLSKNFDKDVDNFRFTIKRTAIPKHMEHTGGYGDDIVPDLVGGGKASDYFHYKITEKRDGKRVHFDIEKDTVEKKQLNQFIQELDKYDAVQSTTVNAYSPNNIEFDNFSLDFSLNDSSIAELNQSSEEYVSDNGAKYSPQFDMLGGKKRYSPDDDSISSLSSNSDDYIRRSDNLTTYVASDFAPSRVWTYHPYLYRISTNRLIIPSFSSRVESPYFYVALFNNNSS